MKKRIVMFIDIDTNKAGASINQVYPSDISNEKFGADAAFLIDVRHDVVEHGNIGSPSDVAFAVATHEIGHALGNAFGKRNAMLDPRHSGIESMMAPTAPGQRMFNSEAEAWDTAQHVFDSAKEVGLSSYKQAVV